MHPDFVTVCPETFVIAIKIMSVLFLRVCLMETAQEGKDDGGKRLQLRIDLEARSVWIPKVEVCFVI